MKKAVDGIVRNAIEDKVFPGCVVAVQHDEECWCEAWGTVTYDENSNPVTVSTVYDVASITKSIPVSCLALLLIEREKLSPDQKLCSIIPEYTGEYRDSITIRHLLTQTLDFGFRLSSCKDEGYEGIRDRILSAPLHTPPGTKYSYANATSILLGWVMERITGMSIDVCAEEMFFKPLGMTNTGFYPKTLSDAEIAPTEFDAWRNRLIQGEVHDESAAAMSPRVIGAAGLFSTGPDIMRFARMLLNKGTIHNKCFFQPKTVSLMYQPADGLADPTEYTGHGWELNQPHFMGGNCTETTFGKTGFTGCSIVVEPFKKIAIVLLSNHVHPKRYRDRSRINNIRSRIAETVFSMR